MVPHRSWFWTYSLLVPPHPVAFGDNSTTSAIGIRTVALFSTITGKKYKIILTNILLILEFWISLISGLYYANIIPESPKEVVHAAVDINLLHWCMGHISIAQIKHMVKWGQLWGINVLTGTPTFFHTDVGGPITPQSLEGYKYWIIINEALQIYNCWKVDVQTLFCTEVRQEKFSDAYVDFIWSNGGGEYINQAF
ncbi:hypothetical protein PAXRUDRAFT_22824 [Paxillus rubicundulus Ve08.2h10]|uniref:Retrovirus-related Pol polyprotein from transposon TNT 1-94-like beta-barrel domain-containing protein n=1 Tax=Paxillus rubicundulus Ve08.2h10 TaxID=930991 RepID=A0A0D0C817_9AGAM|nr:hypothetical protein PAXRUDRAFT_22824 [Paxillus rubicundulus Ve08.2h10]